MFDIRKIYKQIVSQEINIYHLVISIARLRNFSFYDQWSLCQELKSHYD